MYAEVVAEANDALHFGNNDAYINAQADFLWTPRSKESIPWRKSP
jgi:hypothetical protein